MLEIPCRPGGVGPPRRAWLSERFGRCARLARPRRSAAALFLQIKDGIWRAGNGNWWSLIYDTPDGLLIVDPISPDFATWLKGELGRRFPGKPVRYIIYSHSHWDHAAGLPGRSPTTTRTSSPRSGS